MTLGVVDGIDDNTVEETVEGEEKEDEEVENRGMMLHVLCTKICFI